MRFAAFVITFQRPLILKNTLSRLLEQSCPPEVILVVDNGASADTEQIVASLDKNQVLYHPMPENLGPAGGSAYALQWFADQPYDWIYWGDDDDSPPKLNTLERLLKIAIEQGQQPEILGIAATGQWFNWGTGTVKRLPDKILHGIIDVDVIGGGQQFLLRRDVYYRIGVPDHRLFFGYEEFEFCLRLRQAGYRLLIDGDMMYEGRVQTGRLNLAKRRLPHVIQDVSGLWRQYYSTRNYIFMMNETFQRPDLAQREALRAIGRSVYAWWHGPKYGLIFTRFQMQGVLDGYRRYMGRTVLPQPKHTKI